MADDRTTDILMISHRRPDYLRRSLTALLATCDEGARVWLWHNGDDEATLEVAKEFATDARVHRFHHSIENVKLNPPTNWVWEHGTGTFVSKVDDDCVVPAGWLDVLRSAHADNPNFGAVGCWRFHDEDLRPRLAMRKVRRFDGGHRILVHPWVQGSGYLLKRRWVERHGMLSGRMSFSEYCIRLALAGAINGWYVPFLHEDHMDDPRSSNSELRSDDVMVTRRPLSAELSRATTVEEWLLQLQRSAWRLQAGPSSARWYVGARGRVVRPVLRLLSRGVRLRDAALESAS